MRRAAWPITQAAVAAGVAWLTAERLLGHPQPIFAPIAAVVALSANVGGRGRQAVQMLLGVGVGVVAGELLIQALGVGAVQVTVAAGIAMLAMAGLIYGPLPLIQSGATAVIVVATQRPETGMVRLQDSLVGAGIALLFSQVLFSPSPVGLLSGAARQVLEPVAEGLHTAANALASGQTDQAAAALTSLRTGRDNVADLRTARQTGWTVTRLTVRGRSQTAAYGQLEARLRRIDELVESAVALGRLTSVILRDRQPVPDWLPGACDELAAGIDALLPDLTAPHGRHLAGKHAAAARPPTRPPTEPVLAAAAHALAAVAADLLMVAGRDHPLT